MNILNLLAETAETQQTPWGSYIIMGVLFIAIIVMFIFQSRSNKKKQQEE